MKSKRPLTLTVRIAICRGLIALLHWVSPIDLYIGGVDHLRSCGVEIRKEVA